MLEQLGGALTYLVDVTKIPARVTFLFCAVTGALLFLPNDSLSALRVNAFVAEKGAWIGVAFLVFAALTVLHVSMWLVNEISFRRYKSRRESEIILSLSSLDHAEKAVLREFTIQGRSSVMMPIDEPAVSGLLRKGILEQNGSIGEHRWSGFVLPIRMEEFSKQILLPSMIGIPQDPTDDQKRQIINARPAFVTDTIERERHRAGLGSF